MLHRWHGDIPEALRRRKAKIDDRLRQNPAYRQSYKNRRACFWQARRFVLRDGQSRTPVPTRNERIVCIYLAVRRRRNDQILPDSVGTGVLDCPCFLSHILSNVYQNIQKSFDRTLCRFCFRNVSEAFSANIVNAF